MNKIIHGDCLEELKNLPDNSVDLIVTDPPYNTGMKKSERNQKAWLSGFFHDSFSDDEYLDLVRRVSEQMYRVLKDDSAIYIFINWKKLGLWIDELNKANFKVKNTIVWDKVIHGLNYQNYSYTHEMIIFAAKGRFFPKNKEEYKKGLWKDVWHIKRMMSKNQEHETMKALEVVESCIKHGSVEDAIILDPFMGSGTTGVACKKLNRNFIGIEREEEYVKIAEARIDAWKQENKLFV